MSSDQEIRERGHVVTQTQPGDPEGTFRGWCFEGTETRLYIIGPNPRYHTGVKPESPLRDLPGVAGKIFRWDGQRTDAAGDVVLRGLDDIPLVFVRSEDVSPYRQPQLINEEGEEEPELVPGPASAGNRVTPTNYAEHLGRVVAWGPDFSITGGVLLGMDADSGDALVSVASFVPGPEGSPEIVELGRVIPQPFKSLGLDPDFVLTRVPRYAVVALLDRYWSINLLRRDVSAAREKIEEVTERAHREAEERGWCAEFDEIMSDLGLRPRERSFDVAGEVTITVPFLITVSATSSEAAKILVNGWDIGELTGGLSDALVEGAGELNELWRNDVPNSWRFEVLDAEES